MGQHLNLVSLSLYRLTKLSPMLAIAILSACSEPTNSRGGLKELFPDSPVPIIKQVRFNKQQLNYAELTRSGTTPVIFIHGSPGDWKAWAQYLSDPALADYGPLFSVDRPGWGGSASEQVVTDLKAQAGFYRPIAKVSLSAIPLADLSPPGWPSLTPTLFAVLYWWLVR